jgi:hypothetical protein
VSDFIDSLIDNDATITADANSAAFVRPAGCRGVVLAVIIDDAPTGTSPTLDFTLQSSLDGTNWHDVIAMTQFTAAGNDRVEVATAAEPQWRVSKNIGGTNTPSFTGVHTHLLFLK